MTKFDLPFPRGGTASDFGAVTPSDGLYSHLAGRIYEVPDDQHGTGENVLLRVVVNDNASALTTARKFVGFSTTSDYDYGRYADGIAGSAGEACKPIDDAYAASLSIPAYDAYYVVERGICSVQTEAGGVSLAAGDAVATDANGFINGTKCAQATEYAVGSIDKACTTSSQIVAIHVNAGLHQIGT